MSDYCELLSKAFGVKCSDDYMDIEDKICDMFDEFSNMSSREVAYYLRSDGERGEYLLRFKEA